MISFTVHGNAQPAGSKTRNRFGGIRDANPKTKPWQSEVARAAAEAMNGHDLQRGPLIVWMTFTRVRPGSHFNTQGALNAQGRRNLCPTTKPDVLKLARAVEDALSGIVYADDAQIVEEKLSKVYGDKAQVEVQIWAA